MEHGHGHAREAGYTTARFPFGSSLAQHNPLTCPYIHGNDHSRSLDLDRPDGVHVASWWAAPSPPPSGEPSAEPSGEPSGEPSTSTASSAAVTTGGPVELAPYDCCAAAAAAVAEPRRQECCDQRLATTCSASSPCVQPGCGEQMACDELACDELACDELACDELGCDELGCDDAACEQPAVVVPCDDAACEQVSSSCGASEDQRGIACDDEACGEPCHEPSCGLSAGPPPPPPPPPPLAAPAPTVASGKGKGKTARCCCCDDVHCRADSVQASAPPLHQAAATAAATTKARGACEVCDRADAAAAARPSTASSSSSSPASCSSDARSSALSTESSASLVSTPTQSLVTQARALDELERQKEREQPQQQREQGCQACATRFCAANLQPSAPHPPSVLEMQQQQQQPSPPPPPAAAAAAAVATVPAAQLPTDTEASSTAAEPDAGAYETAAFSELLSVFDEKALQEIVRLCDPSIRRQELTEIAFRAHSSSAAAVALALARRPAQARAMSAARTSKARWSSSKSSIVTRPRWLIRSLPTFILTSLARPPCPFLRSPRLTRRAPRRRRCRSGAGGETATSALRTSMRSRSMSMSSISPRPSLPRCAQLSAQQDRRHLPLRHNTFSSSSHSSRLTRRPLQLRLRVPRQTARCSTTRSGVSGTRATSRSPT